MMTGEIQVVTEQRSRPWLWALVVGLLFTLMAITHSPGNISPDMTEYLNQTYTTLGDSPQQARAKTINVYCSARVQPTYLSLDPLGSPGTPGQLIRARRGCVKQLTQQGLLASDAKYGPAIVGSTIIPSARYEAIFLSRPGVAWLYAPGVALLPDRLSLSVTTTLMVLISGLLVFATLRRHGVATPWALLGQTLLYILPVGLWSIDPRSEAPVTMLTAAILLGVVYALTDAPRRGYSLLIGSFVLGFFVKYSQFMLVGAGLAAAAVITALLTRRSGRPIKPLLFIAGVGFAAAVLQYLGSRAMGWPGGQESMQDLLTPHFIKPDVADPVTRWLERNDSFWPWWLLEQVREPLPLFSWLVCSWALVRSRSPIAFAVFAVALTGLANVVGHPDTDQASRLMHVIWFLVAIGLPLLGADIAARRVSPARVEATQFVNKLECIH